MAHGGAGGPGSRPWAGSPALLARAERFLVSRLGCGPEEARQYLRGLVGSGPPAEAGRGTGPHDPVAPEEGPGDGQGDPEGQAGPGAGGGAGPAGAAGRPGTTAEGRPIVSARRPGDVSVMLAAMTDGAAGTGVPGDSGAAGGPVDPRRHAEADVTASPGASQSPPPTPPPAGPGSPPPAPGRPAPVSQRGLGDSDYLRLSEELSAARTPGELARLLQRRLRPFGARAILLAVLDGDGLLRMSGVAGEGGEPVDDWARAPLRYALPLIRMCPSDRLLWLDDETGDRMLIWASTVGGLRPGAACDGRACVVCVVWPGTGPPAGDPGRARAEALTVCGGRRLRDLAALSAPVDDLSGPWLDSILDAIPIPAALLFPIRDRDGRVAEFYVDRCNSHATGLMGRTPEQITGGRLLEAFPGLALSGMFDAYVRVLETGVPLSQEPFTYEEPFHGVLYPAVLSLRAQRVGGGLLVSWQFHDEQARIAARMGDAERLMNLGWAEWNLVTGEIAWSRRIYDIFDLDPRRGPLALDRMAAHVYEDDLPAVVRAVAALSERRAAATFEFRTRRAAGAPRHVNVTAEPVVDALGHLIALRGVVQDVTARRRIEAALKTSRGELERHRRRVAEELQRELLPEWSPDLPGLRVAVRYQPAEDSAQVGGDWYEATTLPDGRVLIAIGDASGHGLQAAARMAQLRNALLGMAFTGADPARMLECLNLVALHGRDEYAIATAIVAHFDPGERTLTWARAGHPAPILAGEAGARQLDNAHGAALGVTPEAGYRSTTTRLRPGDSVVLYTDGLVERHTERGDDRFRLLLDVAGQCAGADPDHQLRSLLSALDTDPQDDTCVIVLHAKGG
ncbi:SpoIIE family protein phosphatase [Actinomadura rugatobispora]|uniref:SpoIIE family protein phosphatase n=1 Tax=Actinomadura rugatobispora TaxID=1994 RepID=A0ABW1A874_9ACTN|nr:SpoIIE family protein phosphatase [Actinomadura rugatobispora]